MRLSAVATTLLTLAASNAWSQDALDLGKKAGGEIKIGQHKVKLDSDEHYEVRVEAEGFTPLVLIKHPRGWTLSELGRQSACVFLMTPPLKGEYNIIVTVSTDFPFKADKLKYALSVDKREFAAKPYLELKDVLTKKSQPYTKKSLTAEQKKKVGSHHKLHQKIKLKGGVTYRIDLESDSFDPILYLEDSSGKVLASNDDGGSGVSARLVFRPATDAEFRLAAVCLSSLTDKHPYRLTIRAAKDGDLQQKTE